MKSNKLYLILWIILSIAIFFLLWIDIGIFPFIGSDLPNERIIRINNLISNISISAFSSIIFFFLIVAYPEFIRSKNFLKTNYISIKYIIEINNLIINTIENYPIKNNHYIVKNSKFNLSFDFYINNENNLDLKSTKLLIDHFKRLTDSVKNDYIQSILKQPDIPKINSNLIDILNEVYESEIFDYIYLYLPSDRISIFNENDEMVFKFSDIDNLKKTNSKLIKMSKYKENDFGSKITLNEFKNIGP